MWRENYFLNICVFAKRTPDICFWNIHLGYELDHITKPEEFALMGFRTFTNDKSKKKSNFAIRHFQKKKIQFNH